MTKRREKKSESLEIRLPYSQKQAFMDACRERGVTASDVLRGFIEDDLGGETADAAPETWAMSLRNNPLKTAAGGISAALAAATFGTGVSFAEDSTFHRFDGNNDGVVSYGEFSDGLNPVSGQPAVNQVKTRIGLELTGENLTPPTPDPTSTHRELFKGLDTDNSEGLTPGEFDGAGTFVKRTDQILDREGEQTRVVGLEVYHYDLSADGTSQVSIEALSRMVPIDADHTKVEAVLGELRLEIDGMRKNRPVPPVPPTPSGSQND